MSFFDFFKVLTAPLMWMMFPTKVYGKEKYYKEKAVICCNHYSGLDVAIIGHQFLWGGCHCIAKEELFHNKFVAWFLRKSGAISIRRGESDVQAYRASLKVLDAGTQLRIFPEGTRNKPDNMQLQPLMPGAVTFALKGGCDIIPMVIHKKAKPFHRVYMLVGDPVKLDAFKDMTPREAREGATALLYETMSGLKAQLDGMVADRKHKKKQAA